MAAFALIKALFLTRLSKKLPGYAFERGKMWFEKVTFGPIKILSTTINPYQFGNLYLILTLLPMITSFSIKTLEQNITIITNLCSSPKPPTIAKYEFLRQFYWF